MKTTATPVDGQTPINITPEEGEKLRECSARCGMTVADFVRNLIQEGIAKLQEAHLTAIPCPFCRRTDSLEIINWSNERANLTEYQGEAVRCNRCDVVAAVAAWARRGACVDVSAAGEKGGAE